MTVLVSICSHLSTTMVTIILYAWIEGNWGKCSVLPDWSGFGFGFINCCWGIQLNFEAFFPPFLLYNLVLCPPHPLFVDFICHKRPFSYFVLRVSQFLCHEMILQSLSNACAAYGLKILLCLFFFSSLSIYLMVLFSDQGQASSR